MDTMEYRPLDATALMEDLSREGFAVRPLLPPDACRALASRYDDSGLFRKRIIMEKHAYGRGEYNFFRYPLRVNVGPRRETLSPPLAAVANAWRALLRS